MDNHKQYLSDTEIIEVIKSYIAEKLYNYAVMIDGEWGSGKTYFVKEILIPKLKDWEKEKSNNQDDYKPKKIIYISLYGVKRVEDISKSIYMENYLDSDKKKKGYSFGSSAVSLGFDILKNKGIDLDREAIKDLLSQFMSLESSILIFDDLERCNIPVNEVLGYINGFVEHQAMKVIIVANQKEVNKEEMENNAELKLLVASNTNIDVPKKDETKNQANHKISADELKYRVQNIFSSQNEYEKIKEKLIGVTIFYTPNLESILHHMILDINVKNYLRKRLENNMPFYINFMSRYNHINLRTFQFYLSKLQILYFEINKYNNTDDFLNYIMKYCFDACCRFKLGIELCNWDEISLPYLEIDALSQFRYYYECELRLRFVDEFVTYSYFNHEGIQETIDFYNRYHSSQAKESSQLIKNLSHGWYCHSEQQVIEWINKLIKNLEDNLYDFEEYAKIIKEILNIVEYAKFDTQIIKKIKEVMIKNIQTSHKSFYFSDTYKHMINNQYIKNQFESIIKELQIEMDKSYSQISKHDVNSLITLSSHWANEILNINYKNNSENHDDIIDIFQYVDLDFLANKVIESSVSNILDFRTYLERWNKRYSDMDKLKILYKKLGGLHMYEDKILKMQFKYLLNDIQRYIDNAKQEELETIKQ